MTQREFCLCMGLMFSSLCDFGAFVAVRGQAKCGQCKGDLVFEKAVASVVPTKVPLRVMRADKLLSTAYDDTLRILEDKNRCSDFFGGSDFSVRVLNEFVGRIEKEYFSKDVGIRMSGRETIVTSEGSTKRYRLFDKVTVNQDGPFYRRRLPASGLSLPNIGNFEPGTNEARILMLLHELGHLIRDARGEYLLPNDGRDEELSRENSRKIERECGKQIVAASKK